MATSSRKGRPIFNPYDILGISVGCERSDIDKAFKKGALKWHPDKNPNNIEKAKDMFLTIVEAYEILKDSSKRVEYEEADAARKRREEFVEERRVTSSVKREHFLSKLERLEREAQSKSEQKIGNKRTTKMEREAAMERKRARDSSLERLAREANEIKIRIMTERVEREAREEAEARRQNSHMTDPNAFVNMTAEDFARLEEEILGGAL